MDSEKLDILFVIVLYKTELGHSATYLSILRSLKKFNYSIDLLVYNNSPGDFECCNNNNKMLNIIYINDKDNSGVSKAYKTGAELATKMKKKWILLLDQDTTFPPQTIEEYLYAVKNYAGYKLFAPILSVNGNRIISPCYFKFMRGFSAKNIKPGVNSFNNYSIVNCGMCINVDAFHENGGYNELLKLDFSDHDFIKRFKKAIANRFVVVNLKVQHQLSTESNNTLTSDMIRFDYYLTGAKNISATKMEKVFLKINSTLRSIKLCLIHRNFSFFIKLLKGV